MKLLPFQPGSSAEGGERPAHAVGRILLENLDRLYSTAHRLAGRADLAEDLVQETARKALQAAPALTDQRNLRAWVFTILVNASRDVLRRDPRWQTDPDDPAATAPNVDAESIARMAAEDVRRGLVQLAPAQRAVVTLVDLEEFTIAEAAHMLKLPPGTVASRLARAHQALRELLRAYAARSSQHGGRP